MPEEAAKTLSEIPDNGSSKSNGATASYAAADVAGVIIAGRYKLLEEVGEGGMGTVWMAQQLEPVKRLVAVKLIKAGMDSKAVLSRFEAERQALALMDHPNIAKVLDGGIFPGGGHQLPVSTVTSGGLTHAQGADAPRSGRPFFVMELVKGIPITKFCDERKLSLHERLDLFVPVCQAIQHAHQKGIIHRDIKPSNILITVYDDKPVPKVIDFGVAKATGTQLTEETINTALGALIGTPEYMSPEQASMNNLDIDTRSDVYALGVVLYELLTGTTPVDKKSLGKAAMFEILRIVREVEATRPSTKLSSSDALPSIAANRHTEPAKLSKMMKGELDWIVMKSLEKDRSRRYETANGFAADVLRYLAGEPVTAVPPSASYRLQKFLRRNRGPVLAASLIFLALLAGIAGTTYGLLRAEQRRVDAEKAQAAEAEQRKIAELEKQKAEQAEAETLADYRASSDDAIEELIGSKQALGPHEKAYLKKMLERWKSYASRQGDDERNQKIRAEGHFRVATIWAKLGQMDQALVEFQQARDAQQRLANTFPTRPIHQMELAVSHTNMGNLYDTLGKADEARAEYLLARDIGMKLVKTYPGESDYEYALALTHNNLGTLLDAIGQRDEALLSYQAAQALQQKLVERQPEIRLHQSNLAGTLNNMALLLSNLGKFDEAKKKYLEARRFVQKLVQQYPDLPQYQEELANNRNNMGLMLANMEKREEAMAEYRAALELRKKLAALFPTVPAYQHELAGTHTNLGNLLIEMYKSEEALMEFKQARDLQQKLVDASPNIPDYQLSLARIRSSMGMVLRDLGKRSEAWVEFHASLASRQSIVEQYPTVPEYRIELGSSYANFGVMYRREGKATECLSSFDQAIRTFTLIIEKDPRDETARSHLYHCFKSRAYACNFFKKYEEAVHDWDRAMHWSSEEKKPLLRASRALSLIRAGRLPEAQVTLDEVIKMTAPASTPPSRSEDDWYVYACLFAVASEASANQKQDYADRAMSFLHKAMATGYKDVENLAEDTDLNSLRQRDDFKKLLAELQKPKPAMKK